MTTFAQLIAAALCAGVLLGVVIAFARAALR